MTGPGDPADESRPERSTGARTVHDWSTESPAIAVIEAVAERTGRDISALDPLYERIDPDALDELFARRPDGVPPEDVELSWRYEGHEVTIRSDGMLSVQPIEDDSA